MAKNGGQSAKNEFFLYASRNKTPRDGKECNAENHPPQEICRQWRKHAYMACCRIELMRRINPNAQVLHIPPKSRGYTQIGTHLLKSQKTGIKRKKTKVTK